MKHLLLLFLVITLASCSNNNEYITSYDESNIQWNKKDKIKVLNFGTFHFGNTNDGHSTDFDEHDKSNQRQAHEIAELLAKFQPTVIIVEQEPYRNIELQKRFEEFKKNPEMKFDYIDEIHLIAFELGRLADSKRIYGIDHQMGYNYRIGEQIEDNDIDSVTYNMFQSNPAKYTDWENMPLKEALRDINTDKELNKSMNLNADILTYVGEDNGFQGADEAAEFYKRNLRMFSNLNKIPLSEDDRVFILMGAGHTAFFRDFISRSPKYKAVPVSAYLN